MRKLKFSDLVFFTVIIFVFQFLLVAPTALAEEGSNFHLTILGGQRNMSSTSDWTLLSPRDGSLDFAEQQVFGIEGDYGKNDWPVNIFLGFASSKSEGDISVYNGYAWVPVKVEASTSEFYVGARKYFNSGQTVRPYLNGAISFITPTAKASVSGVSISYDGDSETGALLGGGVMFQFGKLLLGLDGRLLVGTDISNYSQFGLSLGFAL